MYLRQFLKEYLKDHARITLVEERGDIFYEGDVISLPTVLTRNLSVTDISGLGSQDDIIITVRRSRVG